MSILKLGQMSGGKYLEIPMPYNHGILCSFCSTYLPEYSIQNQYHVWVNRSDRDNQFTYCSKICAMNDDYAGEVT